MEQTIEITRWSDDHKPIRITLIIDRIPASFSPEEIATIQRRAEQGVNNIKSGIDVLPLFDNP